MKLSKILVCFFAALMLINSTDVEAQSKKKVWDATKKAWVWVEKKVEKRIEKGGFGSRHKIKSHQIDVDCDQCSGFGRVQVTVPVTVWNPYYQCYQTQNQVQIQTCSRCFGRGKIQKTIYY